MTKNIKFLKMYIVIFLMLTILLFFLDITCSAIKTKNINFLKMYIVIFLMLTICYFFLFPLNVNKIISV